MLTGVFQLFLFISGPLDKLSVMALYIGLNVVKHSHSKLFLPFSLDFLQNISQKELSEKINMKKLLITIEEKIKQKQIKSPSSRT